MTTKLKAAVELGRLARGVPKNFSRAELLRRKKHMEQINRARAAQRKKQ